MRNISMGQPRGIDLTTAAANLPVLSLWLRTTLSVAVDNTDGLSPSFVLQNTRPTF